MGLNSKKLVTKAKIDPLVMTRNTPFLGIYISFGSNMSRFFDIKSGQHILVGTYGIPHSETHKEFYLKLTPDFRKRKIEKFCVYSDIVNPTIRFGDQVTNLLDMVSVNTGNNIFRQTAPT